MTNRTDRASGTRATQLNPLAKYRLDTSYRSRGKRRAPGTPLPAREPSPWLRPENRRTTTYPTITVEG